MGLEKAGWSVVFANDIDPIKERLYKAHYTQDSAHFITGDIHELDTDLIPDVDLATASFPCTDLSLAGGRKGLAGSQSSAFWGFTSALENLGKRKPPVILLENVSGFLSSHGGKDITSALLELNRLGYAVDLFMVDAIHFVPQSRLRLFIVGSLSQTNQVHDTQLIFYQSSVRPQKLASYIFTHPEIAWHIRELPEPPKLLLTLPSIVEDLPSSASEWWNQERVEYLIAQMSPRHYQKLMQMKSSQDYEYATVFRRIRNGSSMAELRTDNIAGCLRTPKGGSARQILVRAGKGSVAVRLLTPKECARLMGANEFTISGTTNQSLFGFGDAVCVPVITWIAENYLNPLYKNLTTSKEAFYEPVSVGV